MKLLNLPQYLISKTYYDNPLKRTLGVILPAPAKSAIMRTLKDLHRRTKVAQRVDDRTVLMASFPRCGNTWLRYMIASVLHKVETGELKKFAEESEITRLTPKLLSFDDIQTVMYRIPSGATFMKTHLPWQREFRHALVIHRDFFSLIFSLYSMDNFLRETDDPDMIGTYHPEIEFRDTYAREYLEFYNTWLKGSATADGGFMFFSYETMAKTPERILAKIIEYFEIPGDTVSETDIAEISRMYRKSDVSYTNDAAWNLRQEAERRHKQVFSKEAMAASNPELLREILAVQERLDAAEAEMWRR